MSQSILARRNIVRQSNARQLGFWAQLFMKNHGLWVT